jgi:hypothetical protein
MTGFLIGGAVRLFLLASALILLAMGLAALASMG